MTLAAQLHQCIERYNPLQKWARQTRAYLLDRPTLYKIALLANHLFRAIAMAALLFLAPPLFGMGLCLAGSLFYRLTVEHNCAYKFALPALGGACAAWIASKSMAARPLFAAASLLPLCAYLGYIVLTVSYDVDAIRK